MRFLPVGQHAFLVELADLDKTLALFDSLLRTPIDGVEEVVPAARTLMIRLRTGATAAAVAARLARRDTSMREERAQQFFEIPIVYDGGDLCAAAELLGATTEELIRRHTEADYVVAFTGFAPGFAYLTAPGSNLAVPRKQTPRTQIPAGAVGLAGPFSGIYPRASPGGWQIIGTTPLVMFDPDRTPPALLAPGDRVRFRRLAQMPERLIEQVTAPAVAERAGLRVLSAELPVLFEDLGRPGLSALGVSASGAVDHRSLAAANAAVRNPAGAPALETTLGGFSFEAEREVEVALAGAPAPIMIEAVEGRTVVAPHGRPFHLFAGDKVRLAPPGRGMRSYLAIAGGFDAPSAMQSASTDTLSGIGPSPLRAGDRLVAGAVETKRGAPHRCSAVVLPTTADRVMLDVILGPRTDWFTPRAVELLADQDWAVTPQSSRVGIRLAGSDPLDREIADELPSEGAVRGAVQVPPSGQPVVFLSDYPVTGGYPVIASVAPYHLDLAGQIPIGATIRFRPIAPFAEITPTPESSL